MYINIYVHVCMHTPQAGRSLPVRTLKGHTSYVNGVAISGDSQRIASGSDDGTIRMWGMATGRCTNTWEANGGSWVYCVAFSADGKQLASGGRGDYTIKLWGVDEGATQTPTELRTLKGHTDSVNDVKFSGDGTHRLASGSHDGTMRIWSVPTGEVLCVCSGHGGKWVNCVAWSLDGKHVASGGDDGAVQLWDASAGTLATQQPLRGHTSWVTCLVFSNVTRGLLASGSADETIIMWTIVEEGGEVKATVTSTLTGHTGGVWGIALSPDDVYVASASYDETVRVWEVATGQPLRVLQGHTDYVTCAVWSLDGEWIASGSGDKSVRVWRVDAQVPCMCVCMHVHVHVRRLHVRT